MNTRLLWVSALVVALSPARSRDADAQSKEVVFGMQCDRTGPTEIVGSVACVGMHDYVDLILWNKNHLLRWVEVALHGHAQVVHAPRQPLMDGWQIVGQATQQNQANDA